MSSRKVLFVTTITIALAIGAFILFTGVVGAQSHTIRSDISRFSGGTIDGNSNYTLSTQFQYVELLSAGDSWAIVGA